MQNRNFTCLSFSTSQGSASAFCGPCYVVFTSLVHFLPNLILFFPTFTSSSFSPSFPSPFFFLPQPVIISFLVVHLLGSKSKTTHNCHCQRAPAEPFGEGTVLLSFEAPTSDTVHICAFDLSEIKIKDEHSSLAQHKLNSRTQSTYNHVCRIKNTLHKIYLLLSSQSY